MCRCTPNLRTPFCGKLGCISPAKPQEAHGVIPAGWPQPDGTILAALDAAMLRTAERYPWAAKTLGLLDDLPFTIRRQLEADLCNEIGAAIAQARPMATGD